MKQTVCANGIICKTREKVEQSARNVRQAIEKQSNTVTIIAASVDETARTADNISTTIAAIRTDTEKMVENVSHLEDGFRSVDMRLSEMKRQTDEFVRSEEHTSELQSLMRISYAVFCLKKKTKHNTQQHIYNIL